MSHREIRASLFDRFASELTSLVPEVAGRYCCPICLELFERAEVDRMLTLEHIIPDGLGKKLPALTCKTCNNDVGGAKLDSHLHKKLAFESFSKGSGKPVAVELMIGQHRVAANWERLAAEIGISNTLRIVGKASDPAAVQGSQEAMPGLAHGGELNLTFSIASERRANLALLKSGYLLAFAELGYRFILHEKLDLVRQQIQQPAEELLPIDAIVVGFKNPSESNCVMQIASPAALDGIAALLELKPPDGSILHKAILLPTPESPSDFFDHARALRQTGNTLTITGRRLVRSTETVGTPRRQPD